MELPAEDIAAAETATSAAESIQQETGEEGFTLEDILSTSGMEERIVEELTLREALRKLSDRERLVIDLRYFRGLTQDKAAKIIGVSQVQVSRIEKRALENLRNLI